MHKFLRNNHHDNVRVTDQDAPFKTIQTIPNRYKPYLYAFGKAQLDRSLVSDMLYQTLTIDGWTIRNYVLFVKKAHQLALEISRACFILHFNLQGAIDMQFADGKAFRELPRMYQLLQFNTGSHIFSYLPGMYETFYIDFSADWVNKLAPDSQLLNHALSNVEANKSEVMLSQNMVITDEILDILNTIRNLSGGDSPLSTDRISAKIVSLVSLSLIELIRAETTMETSEVSLLIQSIKTYIQNNIDDGNLSVVRLAAIFGFSPRALQLFFRKHQGENLRNYILSVKMEKANTWLKTTDKTIKDIAYDLGYTYAGNFTREFKKYFKQSPLEFQRNQTDDEGLKARTDE